MSEESNDVTKALAAFGAPSIRYHSFGQAQTRPPGLNARRPVAATVPVVPAPGASPVLVQQEEPVAAPEPLPVLQSAPQPVPVPLVAPRPAPFLSEPSAARSTPLFPAGPSIAPPPRPLAEWAAPVSSVPIRPQGGPPVGSAESAYVPPPALAPVMPTAPMPAPVHTAPPAYAPVAPPATPARVGIPNASSSLPEVFDYLAAS